MSIGNILIRPQVLDRHPLSTGGEIMDVLTTLASRLVEDFLRGGPASKKIAEACSESITGFIPQFEPRFEAVGSKLELWLKPYLDLVKNAPTPDTSVAGLVKTSDFGFKLLNKIIDDVHAEPLTGRLTALVDIVENDLGVTREGMEHLFLDMIDRIAVKLANDFLNGNQQDAAVNNFLLSVQIRRIRRDMQQLLDLFPFPDFNPRQMIRDGQLRLEAAGWDAELDKFKGSLGGLQQKITEGVPKLTDLLKFDTANPSLLARDIGSPSQKYAWYVSWFKGEPTAAADNFVLTGSPEADTIKFKVFPLAFLEWWTFLGTLLKEVFKAVANGTHIEKSNFWSPFLNVIGQSSLTTFTLLSLRKDEDWAAFMKIKQSTWFEKFALTPVLTVFGAIEKAPDFWSYMWAFLPLDYAKASEPSKILEWADAINEAILSIFTLLNNDKDDEKAENFQKIYGLAALGRKVAAHFIAKELGQGDRYHSVFNNILLKGNSTIVTYLLGGLVVFEANIVAWLLGIALSGKASLDYFKADSVGGFFEDFISGENAYGAFLVHSVKDFHSAFDLEGDTEGGKYGLRATDTKGTADYKTIKLSGYAPQSTSPYLLPFDKDKRCLCTQTHRGRSSHNNFTGLIYAVDFVLEKGDTILAMRGGTVVAFEDNYAKDDGPKNYIVIRHDTLDAAHDKTEVGKTATTYARYENGQAFSIRRAFASMGITADAIIGANVEQGAPIMLLGQRKGFFEYNHLQVHIWSLTQSGELLPTIPFVFKDISDNGVPEQGKFYTSQNTRKELKDKSVFQALRTAGNLEGSGIDYVILNTNADKEDNFYQNAHILIQYTLPDAEIGFEYKKISRYEGSDRKAFVEGAWLLGNPPPKGAAYSIGAKPFKQSTTLDKQMAFLADSDEAGNAKNLADDRPPFNWMA